MNTLKIGDKFEDKSYNLIKKGIENGELGIPKEYAKVFQKKGYYSRDREKDIIFDLTVEIWPKNAKNFSVLYVIECKSYSTKKVPIDDIEEFAAKISQVASLNTKAILISDNSFQSSVFTYAKNKGVMLIEVDSDENYEIVLHRTDNTSQQNDEENIDDLFVKFLKKTLGFQEIEGLEKLSAEQIENLSKKILKKYNNLSSSIKIDDFITYLKSEYNLEFNFKSNLETVNGKKLLGYFDSKNNTILIDKDIIDTERFPFILGHELGHFFLHKNLKINQEVYNDFQDSEYNIFMEKYDLVNDKNWIEWQANKFSTYLFLPTELFLKRLIAYRISIGISNKPDKIYLDNQNINKVDYFKTVEYLSQHFGISKTSIQYRMEELDIITYANNEKSYKKIIKDLLSNK